MMETPILTKKQQKSTLSAKKNKSKETIKNVLATSFNNIFWPKITLEDHEILGQVLQKNLPRIKENRINIPWRELKNIPKAERRKFRSDYTRNINGQVISQRDSEGLCIGVNSVTKLLERNNGDAVLISGDVHPKLMVQHLVDLAILHRVPVLIFDNLKNILKDHTGISSLAIGIDKDISAESSLNFIRNMVHHIFEKFPPPENHINFDRSLKNKIVDFDVCINEQVVESDVKIDEHEVKEIIHLKRVNKQGRVFIPKLVDEGNQTKMQVDETGFLAFSDEPVVEKVLEPRYKSLIIKRLKGDPNRNKRKIEGLKRKRTK